MARRGAHRSRVTFALLAAALAVQSCVYYASANEGVGDDEGLVDAANVGIAPLSTGAGEGGRERDCSPRSQQCSLSSAARPANGLF